MKDFLTATDIDFVDMCKGIIFQMGLNIMEQEVLSKDLIEFQCLDADNKWRNMKKHPKIIMISRSSAPVEESVMRQLNDKMRNKQILKGIIITSSGFSRGALAFAKERPIELIEKNALQDLLKKAIFTSNFRLFLQILFM
jgi:Restriction endonuclease